MAEVVVNGRIRVLDDPVLVGELLSYESNRNASGSFSYSAPDGMHDDTVMSLAIAWHGLSTGELFCGWIRELDDGRYFQNDNERARLG